MARRRMGPRIRTGSETGRVSWARRGGSAGQAGDGAASRPRLRMRCYGQSGRGVRGLRVPL